MEKVWIFHRVAEGHEADGLRTWFVDIGAQMRLLDRNIVRYSLNLGGLTAADPAARFLGQARSPPPGYDVAEEIWLADPAPWRELSKGPPGSDGRIETSHAYRVSSASRIDRGEPPHGSLKQIALVTWRDDIPKSAANLLWSDHLAVVEKVHPNVWRYIQDGVVDVAGESPPVDGIGVLHYPSVGAYEATFAGDLAGYRAIQADTQGFVGAMPARLLATEYCLKT